MYKKNSIVSTHSMFTTNIGSNWKLTTKVDRLTSNTLQLSIVDCHSLLMLTISLLCKWQRTTILIQTKRTCTINVNKILLLLYLPRLEELD